MDEQQLLLGNPRNWYRNMLNSCWGCLALYAIAQLAGIPFLQTTAPLQYVEFYLLPSLGSVAGILALCELICFYSRRYSDYAIIAAVGFGAAVMVWVHDAVHSILCVMLIPLLASLIFFNRKLSLFALVLSDSLLIAVYALNSHWRKELSPFDLIALLAVSLGATVILFQIQKRANQILAHLRETSASIQFLKAENVIMDKMIKIDGLTGLYNHVTFHDYLDRLMEYADQMPYPPMLALIDVDNFKKVNDTYGHHAGDIVLRDVANVIRDNLAADDFASRYGGEEFAVIVMGRDTAGALADVERIRATVAGRAHPEVGNRPVTVSIGLKPYRAALMKNDWFQAADSLLYEAKRSGKNKTVLG